MLDERRDLRRLLGELTPAQWQQESLCAGWTIGELVAHLIGWDDLLLYRSRREHLRALLRFVKLYGISFGSMTAVNRRIGAAVRDLTTPQQLMERFGTDDSPELKWLFDGTNTGGHLAEYVIHHQDVRRPLHLPREIPSDRLVGALHGVTQLPGVRGPAWRRLMKQRWEATDVAWSRGRGAVVRTSGEAILMTLAGRQEL